MVEKVGFWENIGEWFKEMWSKTWFKVIVGLSGAVLILIIILALVSKYK